MPAYPNANQWSTTHHVQVRNINPTDPEAPNSSRFARFEMMERTHIFDGNLQKELLSEYKQNSKNKSQEYTKFLVDKKILITIIFGQCNEATKTEIALGVTYVADRQGGNLIKLIKQLRTVCFGDDDGGLSYGLYKQVVAIK